MKRKNEQIINIIDKNFPHSIEIKRSDKLLITIMAVTITKLKNEQTEKRGRKNKFPIEFYLAWILYALINNIPWDNLPVRNKCHPSTIKKKFLQWRNNEMFEDTHLESLRKYKGVTHKKIKKLYSPFFGGGSFELSILKKHDITLYANDKFEPLMNFWGCLKKNKKKLVEEVKKLHPITKKQFMKYKEILKDEEKNDYKRAACYFAVNRSSFSGSTMSGGFSKESGEKRFTESSITRLSKMSLDDVKISNEDFTTFINEIEDKKNCFIFMDPPYYLGEKSKLYGNNGDLHEKFDHKELYNTIKNKKNWILCYNDCEYIRKLYKKFQIDEVNWKYGMNASKKSSEIIITNL